MTRTPSRIGAAAAAAVVLEAAAELTPVQRLVAILSMRWRLLMVVIVRVVASRFASDRAVRAVHAARRGAPGPRAVLYRIGIA